MNNQNEKKILWYNLAFMAFSTVWGFGNVINGFSEYGGLKAIVSWVILFALYFIPYALMVGELGSAFKNEGGGVSSWIHQTIGPGMAYMAGWTYWVVHMPYISQKPNASVIAASWALFRDSRASQMNVRIMDRFQRTGGSQEADRHRRIHHVYHVPALHPHDDRSAGYHRCERAGHRLVFRYFHAHI